MQPNQNPIVQVVLYSAMSLTFLRYLKYFFFRSFCCWLGCWFDLQFLSKNGWPMDTFRYFEFFTKVEKYFWKSDNCAVWPQNIGKIKIIVVPLTHRGTRAVSVNIKKFTIFNTLLRVLPYLCHEFDSHRSL